MVTKGGNRDMIIGALVVCVAALALGLVYAKDAGPSNNGGYGVLARFNRLDGISVGSPVRLSGVPIGRVESSTLEADFRAVTRLHIKAEVELPTDTSASIRTDGLLGAKYIELTPGGEEKMMKDGDSIDYTQDSMVIEDLLEMIIEQGKSKRGYAGRDLPSVTN